MGFAGKKQPGIVRDSSKKYQYFELILRLGTLVELFIINLTVQVEWCIFDTEFDKVGWGTVGRRGKVGLLRCLPEISFLVKSKKG